MRYSDLKQFHVRILNVCWLARLIRDNYKRCVRSAVYFPFRDHLIKREILGHVRIWARIRRTGKSYHIKVVSVAVRRLILRPRKRIKSRFPPLVVV